jgi:hypothetical protein
MTFNSLAEFIYTDIPVRIMLDDVFCVPTEVICYLVSWVLLSVFMTSATAELMSSFRESSDDNCAEMSGNGNCKRKTRLAN